MTCIHYSEFVPPYRDGISWSTPILPPSDPASELIGLAIGVATLKYQCRHLFETDDATAEDVLLVLAKAETLDQDLVTWSESLGPEWDPYSVVIPSNDASDPTRKRVWKDDIQIYRNIWFGSNATMLYVLRIHVNAVILRCLHATVYEPDAEKQCLARLQYLADRICACIAPGIENIVPAEQLPPGFDAKASGAGAVVG